MSDFLRNIETFDTEEETYAMKSYILIEQETHRDQRHLYEIIKNIIALKSK